MRRALSRSRRASLTNWTSSCSYTYLLVAGEQSTLSATRIGSIASFTSTLTAAAMGIVVRYMRYLKPIIIAGFCIDVCVSSSLQPARARALSLTPSLPHTVSPSAS